WSLRRFSEDLRGYRRCSRVERIDCIDALLELSLETVFLRKGECSLGPVEKHFSSVVAFVGIAAREKPAIVQISVTSDALERNVGECLILSANFEERRMELRYARFQSFTQLVRPFSVGARRKRMEQMLRLANIREGTSVLDLGGTPRSWNYPFIPSLDITI